MDGQKLAIQEKSSKNKKTARFLFWGSEEQTKWVVLLRTAPLMKNLLRGANQCGSLKKNIHVHTHELINKINNIPLCIGRMGS